MSPEEVMAFLRAFKTQEEAARAALVPGEYPVDATLRVQGTLSVGEDTDRTPTVSVPWTAVVAVLLHRMGCTREGAISVLTEILPQVVGQDGFNAVLTEADVKSVGIAALASLKGVLPRTPVKGQVKFTGEVTPVV